MEGRDVLEFYYCSYLFLRKQKITYVFAHWNYLMKSKKKKKKHKEREKKVC